MLVGSVMILSRVINVTPTYAQGIESEFSQGAEDKTVVGYIICRTGCTILRSRVSRYEHETRERRTEEEEEEEERRHREM